MATFNQQVDANFIETQKLVDKRLEDGTGVQVPSILMARPTRSTRIVNTPQSKHPTGSESRPQNRSGQKSPPFSRWVRRVALSPRSAQKRQVEQLLDPNLCVFGIE